MLFVYFLSVFLQSRLYTKNVPQIKFIVIASSSSEIFEYINVVFKHSTKLYDHDYNFLFFSDLKKQFEVNPTSTRVEVGHRTELRCVPPVGLPPPRIYWLRGGQPLQTDTSIIVSTEGHLLISQARTQDTGNYTCVAENIAAKRMANPALITVYGK